MRIDALNIRKLGSRKSKKLVLHFQRMLIHDSDVIGHQQIVHICNDSCRGILYGQHCKIGFLIDDSLNCLLKSSHMEAVHIFAEIFQHGGVTVGTFHSLKYNLFILIDLIDFFKAQILRQTVFCLDLILAFTADGYDLL